MRIALEMPPSRGTPPEGNVVDSEDGVVLIGADLRIEDLNEQARALFDVPEHDIVGQPVESFLRERDRPRLRKALAAFDAGRQVVEVIRIETPDGPSESVEIRARRTADGRTLAVLRSVREMRIRERVLHRIALALSEGSGDEMFARMAHTLADALRVDYAFVGELVEPARDCIRVLAMVGPNGLAKPVTYPLDGAPCELVVRGGEPVFTSRAQEEFPNDEIFVQLGIHTYQGMPLRDAQGEPIGVLGVMARAPLSEDSIVTSTLALVASRAAAEILRARAEARLKRNERHFRALIQASSRFVWGVDANQDPTFGGDAAWTHVSGHREEDGHNWLQAIVPEDRDGVGAEWGRAFAEQREVELAYRVAAPDGEVRNVHVRGIPTFHDDGSFEGFIGTIDDVTPLYRAADELRRQNAMLHVLRAVGEAKGGGAGFLECVRVALGEICRSLPFELGEAFVWSAEAQALVPTGLRCADQGDGARAEGDGPVLLGGAAGARLLPRVSAASEPVWVESLAEADVASLDPSAGTGRDRAGVFVPVRFAGDLLAVLELQTGRPMKRDDTLVEVLSQVGLQLARAHEREFAQKQVREAQLRALESQKLEAVGRLAGGIAHDFNNLLMVVLGEAELAMRDPATTPALRSSLEEIRASGRRAASLTAQLLAFARRDIVRSERIDMCSLVRDAERMLRRVIGEDVRMTTVVDTAPGGCVVVGNRGLFEQVLMNLVVNAREAMPEGGDLEVSVRTSALSAAAAAAAGGPEAKAGRYVVVSVRDTGHGIPPEHRAAIFEPFFTTKPEGGGFGLATSYGLVRAAGGFIEVESEVGSGSVFRVHLPVEGAAPKRADSSSEPDTQPAESGNAHRPGHVLIVEDDDAVRSVAVRILDLGGYRVSAARDLAEAERRLRDAGPPDVLLTDCVLEHESGREIDEWLRDRVTGPRGTVFMSGYTDDLLIRGGHLPEGKVFLAKPFSADGLLEAVGRVFAEMGMARQPRYGPDRSSGRNEEQA
ncbi:MAG: ATP-binding protein [Gemmatimonadales bacterium]